VQKQRFLQHKTLIAVIVLLVAVPVLQVYPTHKKDIPGWEFGENLAKGDLFVYEICDSLIAVPESPEPCYTLNLKIIDLLPSHAGPKWIVSAHVVHGSARPVQTDMIWQMDAKTFRIDTDGFTREYARSFERTVGWVMQYATPVKPQTLQVGNVWGQVRGDVSKADLQVMHADSVSVGSEEFQTYRVGYTLVKESYLQIKDGFPFPVKAAIFKPVSSHQDIPLAISYTLTSYQKSKDACSFDGSTQPFPFDIIPIIPQLNMTEPQDQKNKTVSQEDKESVDDGTDDLEGKNIKFDAIEVDDVERIEETNSTDIDSTETDSTEDEDSGEPEDGGG